jgi:low temperature requirement protein LtrA
MSSNSSADDREIGSDHADQEDRVLTAELFFDLVFVFTVTQLTIFVVWHPTWRGVGEASLIFGILWWMFGGYAWLTNVVPPKKMSQQLLILLGMGAFLVIALAIPGAYSASGVAFGIGYFVVVLVHAGLFMTSTDEHVVRAILRFGPVNMATAALVLAGGFSDGTARWILWAAAVAIQWISPFLSRSPVGLRPGHFVERHSVVVLITLGESVVAAGIALRTQALTGAVLVTAIMGLAIAAEMWWLYSGQGEQAAERALARAPAEHRARLALYAFGYIFLSMVPGIILFAAGVRLGVRFADRSAAGAGVWLLAGGIALYCAGLAAFRRVLALRGAGCDLLMAILVLLTPVLGLCISVGAELGSIVAILAATAFIYRVRAQKR